MKNVLKIGTRTIPVWLLITVVVIAAAAAASVIIGTTYVGYKITPSAAEAPAMTPETLNLDLGSIPSGSSENKDFGKAAALNLPAGYEITFTLNLATAGDFTTFDVDIIIYKTGETVASYWLYLYNNELFYYDSRIMDAGAYDVQVKVTYTAVSVSTETTGNVEINISYPG